MPNDQISSIGQAAPREPAAPVSSRPAAPAAAPAAGPPAAQQQASIGDTVPLADPAVVKKAAEQINEFMRSSSRNLQFSVDKGTGRIIVKVVDQESGEVIRQIPPEETLAIAKNLDMPQGMIIRSKA